MKSNLKNILYNLAFIPQYSPFAGTHSDIRPYWGFSLPNQMGGPVSRTKRMMEEFGQYRISPNVIHVNSAWDEKMFQAAIRTKNRGLKMVFNQNGHYYPAWYKGDWKKANANMAECQKYADFVFFQSEFSLQTQKELHGYLPENRQVLLNAVPGKVNDKIRVSAERKKCLVSGVFGADAYHILKPALEAFQILSNKNNHGPMLVLAGKFTQAARDSQWFKEIDTLISDLIAKGAMENRGSFESDDYLSTLQDIDLALHLKYKDPCPNAVVERMLQGIPHVFSNSGGTPELVGTAGIPLKVCDSWDSMISVNSDELAQAIEKLCADLNTYQLLTIKEAQTKHSWEKYVATYRDVFKKVL